MSHHRRLTAFTFEVKGDKRGKKFQIKNMTKKDLKNGMVVKMRDGELLLVITHFDTMYADRRQGDTIFLCINHLHTWYTIDYFEDDLTYNQDSRADRAKSYDIVEVYLNSHPYAIRGLFDNKHNIVFRSDN